jgi:hypothetical protein
MEVLLTPSVRQLVQHHDIIAVLQHTLAHKRRADKPRTTTHEQFHARIIPALAVYRCPAELLPRPKIHVLGARQLQCAVPITEVGNSAVSS